MFIIPKLRILIETATLRIQNLINVVKQYLKLQFQIVNPKP